MFKIIDKYYSNSTSDIQNYQTYFWNVKRFFMWMDYLSEEFNMVSAQLLGIVAKANGTFPQHFILCSRGFQCLKGKTCHPLYPSIHPISLISTTFISYFKKDGTKTNHQETYQEVHSLPERHVPFCPFILEKASRYWQQMQTSLQR